MIGHSDYRMAQTRQQILLKAAAQHEGASRRSIRKEIAVALSTALVATALAAYLMGPASLAVVTDGLVSANAANVTVIEETLNPLGDVEAVEDSKMSGASAQVYFK